ncbi:hypothetical protein M316_0058 [Nitrincola phage 1M3-16]|uniref:hypothetical protein n=1 Tax=Nitrincola phage 1M3-16 TaxID=1472912 RepID=UPI000444D16A|nr:hypothetical protein GJ22_gp094 [Nitrincola phage 1M3-16]AHX01123.1 hypothetical protein M316_0058 [Nitrincola phage 1M3-16]
MKITDKEFMQAVTEILLRVDTITNDQLEQQQILKTACSVIEHEVQTAALRQALFNALTKK